MSDDGSDDSPPRPKRRIKKVLVLSSESGSDSDESIGATTRRKRLRVVSDAESSSSGGSVVRAGTRHRRTLPKLRDSDADSDSSSGGSKKAEPKPTPTSKPTSGFASDSSEGNSDKCSICLLRFTDQMVGTPENCEHIFCLDCITEWSKNVNTCPVDRITFNSIVVKVCAGGRVLRTEPVKVVERRSSVDLLVVEDPTVCEVCGSTDNEECMLLCDGCDLGYHMQCLVPPLSEVPIDQWLCPNCDDLLDDDLLDVIHLSEVNDLFSGIVDLDLPLGPRPAPLREARNVRRSSRNVNRQDEPSTSSGRRGGNSDNVPTTSRGSRVTQSSARATTRRTTTGTKRRRTKRRSKTVVIEYEVQENGKFPVTKSIKRRVKKRRTKKRQPRTAARRSYVRASVRAKLADWRSAQPGPAPAPPPASHLALHRQRAGIPALSLFGNHNQLEYFSEDEGVSEGATTAVVARPTSSIISAYRQARRKMISIPSPPHAASAPDVLSSILESQTLLHSKKSIVSVTVDGNVSIKLETNKNGIKKPVTEKKDDKVDLSKGEDASKKVPSYPGQSRGGGGWGGGYRGNYHREQTGNFRGGYDGGYQGYQPRPQSNNYQNNARREDDSYGDFPRRPHQYLQDDDFDRRRSMPDNRQNFQNQRQEQRFGNNWQPYHAPQRMDNRSDGPPARHSFGGFENPLDMRTGAAGPQSAPILSHPAPQPYRPLPEPPTFKFDTSKTPEVDKSEDERSDSGLVIDTEKYDPTDPTNDDGDSGEESGPSNAKEPLPASPAPPPPPALPAPPSLPTSAALPAPPTLPPGMQSLLAGIDTTSMNVSPSVLDTAVRQVLQEHRGLISSPTAAPRPLPASDDDSDGDCPNFSIYSATSVHIANNTGITPNEQPPLPPVDDMQDLVQEDDDTVTPEGATPETGNSPRERSFSEPEINEVKKKEDEYKEKLSKRCPITTIPRNPIKIKLNTPSLIKRRVSLYDDDEPADEEEITPKTNEMSTDKPPEKQNSSIDTIENASIENEESNDKEVDEEFVEESEAKVLTEEDDRGKSSEKDDGISADKDDEEDEINDDIANIENGNRLKTPETEDKNEYLDKEDEDGEGTKSEGEHTDDEVSEPELGDKRRHDNDEDKNDEVIEKMTESISETEDERSYTPCLDENKSKDTSLETEKDKGLEGLDTEMISEDEGNEMFSDQDKVSSQGTPPAVIRQDEEDGEITEKRKDKEEKEEGKKKKKKDSKKEGKEKSKSKKKGDVVFKKLSKSGKERNYRERDKKKNRDSDGEKEKKKRKEKRKDLERYDVRTVVTEKRRKVKDPFGRDVSPHRSRSGSASASPGRAAPAASPARRRSLSRPRRSLSRPKRSMSRLRRSISRPRRSISRPRRSMSRARRSLSRARPSVSPPRRLRGSPSLRRSVSRPRRSISRPRRSVSRARLSLTPRSATPVLPPVARRRSPGPARRRRRSGSRRRSPRRRRSGSRGRKRRRSASKSPSKPKTGKRRRRARSERAESRPRRKAGNKRTRRQSPVAPVVWSPASVDSRLLSPRTPPPDAPLDAPPTPHKRRDSPRPRHRRIRDTTGPSKEVFTSGDNILVSVSFKDQDRARSASGERQRRKSLRRSARRRRRQQEADPPPRPVAIIDLERSPFRELTPEQRDVIVLSDSDHGKDHTEKEPANKPPQVAPAPEPAAASGPKTPPSPRPAPAAAPAPAPAAEPPGEEARGPNTPPEPPESPDAYDPFEPTRSASNSPGPAEEPAPAAAPRTTMTLEAAQKTNMSADEVIDRRPLSPMEKVLQLLQSTRDAPPSPPPHAPHTPPPAAPPAPKPPRIVLPEPAKLFLAKPSPIKSDPIKPMQMQTSKISRLPLPPGGRRPAEPSESPYSPGSSDFGELFEPRARSAFDALADKPPRKHNKHAKVPVKLRKKGKTQVGVKIDEDNLKILDELPSSAVEMQVKSKFLKKLNRQERVVEEVKLVLKPHYNKKHVSKDQYKDILRRAVPKICHNKTGEINPTKIQALVEAYVKKFRKKHKQPPA